jgi:hypothetical protein
LAARRGRGIRLDPSAAESPDPPVREVAAQALQNNGF